jgi:hypothetical protein
MKVITSRPIKTEETSSCCGTSGFDAYSECCGMSNFDDDTSDFPTDLSDYSDNLGDDMDMEFSFASGKFKGALSKLRPDKAKMEQRQANRQTRRSERKKARADKKAKKNSKRLVLFKKKDGSERFLFPLSKLKFGKKKYKDGTETEIKKEDQVTIKAPNGETAIVDKQEVAKAIGKPASEVTQAEVQAKVTIVPQTMVTEQGVNNEVQQPIQEPVIAIEVAENLVESANNGELYVATDLQNINEKEKDVKEEERGLTKTQKIVLWSAVGVGAILIGYIIYKSVTKNK